MSATAIAPRFITPDEVAAEVFSGAIAADRVIRLSKSQGLPSHRVGRRRMYLADEVIAWARSRDGDGDIAAESTAPPVVVEHHAKRSAADDLVERITKLSPDDLRRAAELLLTLSREDGAA